MAKPKKRKRAKKTAQELHDLTTDELMQHVFGKEGHAHLKAAAAEHDKPKKKDWRVID